MSLQPDANNPAGSPPSAAEAPAVADVPADIIDILGLSDTSSEADKIASGAATPNEPPAAAAAAPSEAGEAATAPASPVTPPEAGTPPPPPPATPAPTTGTPPVAPAAAVEPSATPAVVPAVDESALKTASLEATVDALQRELAALRASPAGTPPAPGTAPSPEQPAEPAPFKYALTLPKQVQDAILSDDPAQNLSAITNIVNDLGTIVHNTVLTQVRGEMQSMITSLAGMAQEADLGTTRQTAAEQSRQAYYTAFPDHNNPLILPIIQAESQKMAAEFPQLSWNEQYQAALGQRVNATLAQLRGGAAPATEAVVPAGSQPAARPAAMLPSGQRAASVTPVDDIGADVVDLLDPFSGGG